MKKTIKTINNFLSILSPILISLLNRNLKELINMKILLLSTEIAPDLEGGIGRYTREIYDELRRRNIEVRVISKKIFKKLKDPRIKQISTPKIRFLWIPFFSYNVNKIIKEKFKEYHIHACCFRAAVPLLSSKLPFTITIHDIGSLIYPGTFIEKTIRKEEYIKVCKYAKKILVPSYHTKKELLKRLPWLKNKVIVNQNGINTNLFRPIVLKEKNAKELLFVGRIAENKGIGTLIDAYKILKQRMKINLTIVGKPMPTTKNFFNKIKSENPNIKFLDNLKDEELVKAYSITNVLVCPSEFSEGFGFMVGEAMACGTQVVASNLPSFKEVGGDYVYYFKKGDSVDLATKIEKALNKPLSSIVIRNHIKKSFSWKNHVDMLINVIKSVR